MNSNTVPFQWKHDVFPPPLLKLPLELRLQVYQYLFSRAPILNLRSLFIRTNFRNIFMTQQLKELSPAILRVCRQITREALPLLYSQPRWVCGCRVEALAVQIGRQNFAQIKRMSVDIDDLDMLVENVQHSKQRRIHRNSGYAMQLFPVRIPDALRTDYDHDLCVNMNSFGSRRTSSGALVLGFNNLEVLEVDGYQSAALNSHGTSRMRVEAIRLCELAMQLLDFHPQLKWLLQKDAIGDGGADARDLSLGRVKWRFVKDLPLEMCSDYKKECYDTTEHMVDLGMMKSMLEFILQHDEKAMESSLPVSWTTTGNFNLYPFLQTSLAMA